jgi:hypothetical protein
MAGMNRIIITVIAACLVVMLNGCAATKDHYVIAATGTVIGVEIAQNPVNQSPQAKLGYNRSELAIVPTNRGLCVWNNTTSKWECSGPGPQGSGGAKDSTDVLMELRYGGIFSLGVGSVIYQRLAVGSTAVKQPGAAFMFAKDAQGSIDNDVAGAVASTIAPEALTKLQAGAVDKVTESVVIAGSTQIDTARVEKIFVCNGYTNEEAKKRANRYSGMSEKEFNDQFFKDYRWQAEEMLKKYKECD